MIDKSRVKKVSDYRSKPIKKLKWITASYEGERM